MASRMMPVISAPHSSITPGFCRQARMLVRPAEIASTWRSMIIGIEITLVVKIRPANTAPTTM